MTISLCHCAQEAQNGSKTAMESILRQFEPLVRKQSWRYRHYYQSIEEARSSIHHAAISCIIETDLSTLTTLSGTLAACIHNFLEREAYRHKRYHLRIQKNIIEGGSLTDLPVTYAASYQHHPEHKLLEREQKQLLFRALQHLPKIEARCIICHYFKNQSYRAIGSQYQLSAAKVRRLVKKGERQIKEELLQHQFSLE